MGRGRHIPDKPPGTALWVLSEKESSQWRTHIVQGFGEQLPRGQRRVTGQPANRPPRVSGLEVSNRAPGAVRHARSPSVRPPAGLAELVLGSRDRAVPLGPSGSWWLIEEHAGPWWDDNRPPPRRVDSPDRRERSLGLSRPPTKAVCPEKPAIAGILTPAWNQ